MVIAMLLLLCVCIGGLVASSTQDTPHYNVGQAELLFEEFILTHEKTYATQEEKQTRFEIFKASLKRINERNLIGDAVFAINHFSDMTPDEINQYTGFIPSFSDDNKCEILTDKDINTKDAPASLDWFSKGAVTEIKDQKKCGSCWAFACIANIEGQYFIENNKLQIFSQQEFVDCSKNSLGCRGGDMGLALSDVMELGGVELESSYPYIGKQESCKFNISKAVAKVKSCKVYALKDEEKLKELLAKKGPLILGINAERLFDYKKGIMNAEQCDDPFFSGHAVLLMGYGTENGVDYWRIKNSWGTRFGEEGYFRVSRGEDTCQLLHYILSADL